MNGGCVVAAGDLLEEENKGLVNILGTTRTQEKVGMYSNTKCAVWLQLHHHKQFVFNHFHITVA